MKDGLVGSRQRIQSRHEASFIRTDENSHAGENDHSLAGRPLGAARLNHILFGQDSCAETV